LIGSESVTGTIADNGDIVYSHGYTSRKEAPRSPPIDSGSDLGSGFSGSGFSFHSSPKSWHAARQDCQSRGGDLASIHSEAEHREAIALTGGRHAWIGLNDEEDEGNHVWSDGTPMDYHGWSGYPASPPLPPLPPPPPSPPPLPPPLIDSGHAH
jgi:hypothetical protein